MCTQYCRNKFNPTCIDFACLLVATLPGSGGVSEWVYGKLLPAWRNQSGGCGGLYHRERKRTHQPTHGGEQARSARWSPFFSVLSNYISVYSENFFFYKVEHYIAYICR